MDSTDIYNHFKNKNPSQPCLSNSMRVVLISILRVAPLTLRDVVSLMYVDTNNNNYIDLKGGTIHIRSGTDTTTYVIDDSVVADVSKHRRDFDHQHVFLKNVKPYHDPMTYESMRHFWTHLLKSYCKESGVQPVKYSTKQLRHN